jgi:hypothetical protein
MTSLRVPALGAAIVLSCALMWPASASAQDDEFRRGLDARGDKNWAAVVMHMRAAIALDPMESMRKVGGGFLRPFGRMDYLPHFFLGEALFNLQECAAAVEEYGRSEQQGAVRARREFVAAIADGYQKCAARGVLPPSEFAPLQLAATQTVSEATALADRVSKRGQQYIELWTRDMDEQYAKVTTELTAAQSRLAAGSRARSAADFAEARAASGRATGLLRGLDAALTAKIENRTFVQRQAREVNQLIAGAEENDRAIENLKNGLTPALAASRQNGRELLARARERVDTGERSQNGSAVNEGLRAAQDAAAVFAGILKEAGTLVKEALAAEVVEAVTAATDAFSFLDTAFATLERLVAEKREVAGADIDSRREAIQKRVAALRRRLETARKSENVAGIREAARLASDARTELDTLITSFGPVTLRDRGVHAALEDGARLFFGGEYQQAVAALGATTLTDAPLQLHVHLLRAAALYHLFMHSGGTNQELRRRSLAEVEACKRLNPGFTPDAQVFGPRFLTFFQDAAAPVTP